jgi:hypothetical protein
MSYQIVLTDGSLLTTVPDGQTVTTFAGLTLIGKSYAGYGTAFNDNLVRMAENFAASTPPANPFVGQIWYDNQAGAIKFYDGTAFNSISVITAASTAPANPGVGDEWYNTVTQQLFIWSGSQWILVGPINTAGSGLNGIVIGDVVIGGVTYYFVELYADNRLVGIISSDTLVNPGITGFGNLNPGLNFVTSPTSGIVSGGIYNVSNLTVGNNNQITAGIDGSSLGYLGVNGNVQVGKLIYVQGTNSASSVFPNAGGYLTWNYSAGNGETDFINNQGSGTGGFSWYNANNVGGNITSIMSIDGAGNLNLLGSLEYNSGTSFSIQMPNNRGTNGEVLSTYGNGVTFWNTTAVTPLGINGAIQYNNNGNFGGASGVTVSNNGNSLSINSNLSVGGNVGINGTLSVQNAAIFDNDIFALSLPVLTSAGINSGVSLYISSSNEIFTDNGIHVTQSGVGIDTIHIFNVDGTISANLITADAITLTSGAPVGYVLTGNGNSFVPQSTALTRGSFTLPGGSLGFGAQTIFNTGISVTSGQVPAVSVSSGSINPILVYAVATFGGTIQLVVSNTSSSTQGYGALLYNYVIL